MEKNKIFIWAFLILLAVVLAFSLFSKKIFVGKVVDEPKQEDVGNIPDEDWLFDNCNCTARERRVCGDESFEYSNGFCRYKNMITNPILKCSEYNCSEQNYMWKYDQWQVKGYN